MFFDRSGIHDITNGEVMTSDPEESKLDYWREDSCLHVFHTLFHRLYDYKTNLRPRWHRSDELFWYAHQQMVRRFVCLLMFNFEILPCVLLDKCCYFQIYDRERCT